MITSCATTVLDSGELVAITQPRWCARVVPVQQVVDIRVVSRASEEGFLPAHRYDRTGRVADAPANVGVLISALA